MRYKRKKPINHQERAKEIRMIYGFDVKVLQNCIRVSDGDKKLDIYRNKWHDLNTHERGSYSDYEKLVFNHFLIQS